MFPSYGLQKQIITIQRRNIKMKSSPYIQRYETIDDKSQRRKLPISPDFGVYQPQLTTILSISHRLSGLALVNYTTLLGFNAIFGKHEISDFITMVEGLQLSSPALVGFKYLLVYPFAFHACLGIRHLLWDYGMFLTIRGVYTSGYIAFCSSFALAGVLAML